MLRLITRLILLIGLSLPASPAMAQATDPLARCQSYLEHLPPDVTPNKPPEITVSGEVCKYANLRLGPDRQTLVIPKATVRTLEFDPADPQGVPLAFDGSFEGLVTVFGSLDKSMQYITEMTDPGMSFGLRYHVDQARQLAIIDALDWSVGRSTVKIQGEVNHVPARMVDGRFMPRDDVAVKRLRMVVNDVDWNAQRILAWLLGPQLLAEADDPTAKVAELKDVAAAWMRDTLPRFNIDAASIDALEAAMRALPKGDKRLTVDIDLPEPVGFYQLTGIYTGNLKAEEIIPTGAVKVRYGE